MEGAHEGATVVTAVETVTTGADAPATSTTGNALGPWTVADPTRGTSIVPATRGSTRGRPPSRGAVGPPAGDRTAATGGHPGGTVATQAGTTTGTTGGDPTETLGKVAEIVVTEIAVDAPDSAGEEIKATIPSGDTERST